MAGGRGQGHETTEGRVRRLQVRREREDARSMGRRARRREEVRLRRWRGGNTSRTY